MNYPVWQLDAMGGGLLIAMIAVFHVYISHFAVGGGLFLVLTEMKGYRDNNQSIIDYVKKHSRFFLLLTMVAGSMTGVGIWFTIALLNPGATSVLIHTFVFGWATEWVFFLLEIVSLFIYYYTFGRMNRRTHLLMGWIYFAAAWISLFIINGIIDFMLTPGTWLQNNNFWAGFFNPTFWPALFFRSFLAFMIAGLFGLLTATWLQDEKTRQSLVRYCALWLLVPLVLFLASAWWYKAALPPDLRAMIFQTMPEMKLFIRGFVFLSPILLFGGLFMAIRMPAAITRPMAAVMLLIGFAYMGCFEFIREGGRRPYIIHNYMFSNSIFTKDLARVQEQGVLKSGKWIYNKQINPDNRLAAGREIYNVLCLSCHSIAGPLNDIKTQSVDFTEAGLDALMSGLDKIHPYMPPFAGNAAERQALAFFIANSLNGKQALTEEVSISQYSPTVPAFDREKDEYVLLGWSDMGMRSMTDTSNAWMILPPGVNLHALLIRRGETPEVVSDGVSINYKIADEFADPAQTIDFWKNADKLFKRKIKKNTGLSGNTLQGTMAVGESGYVATMLPVTPYPDKGGYLPYPAFSLTAEDNNGIIAGTRVVAPVATEMGCNKCHEGKWRISDRAGFTCRTAENVLAAHDHLSGTNLEAESAAGHPVLCQNCHADELLSMQGNNQQLNMSAAIHGFHALFLSIDGAEACTTCHPAAENGATRAFRGIHHEIGLDCCNCHGEMADHALALLQGEKISGKKRADWLINNIKPGPFSDKAALKPRKPWINEPDCLNCHQEFQPPETDSTFKWTDAATGLFRNRTDESGQIPCAACHNSPHAIYPASNPYGDLDSIQPRQYQNEPYPIGSNLNCAVCHTIAMEDEMHHVNMLREFRN